jgi:hypothetical protein
LRALRELSGNREALLRQPAVVQPVLEELAADRFARLGESATALLLLGKGLDMGKGLEDGGQHHCRNYQRKINCKTSEHGVTFLLYQLRHPRAKASDPS